MASLSSGDLSLNIALTICTNFSRVKAVAAVLSKKSTKSYSKKYVPVEKKQRKDRLYKIKKDGPSHTKQQINVKVPFFNYYSYPLVITLPPAPQQSFLCTQLRKILPFFISLIRLIVVSCFSLFCYKVIRVNVYVDLLLHRNNELFFLKNIAPYRVYRVTSYPKLKIFTICFYFFTSLRVESNEFHSERAIDLSIQHLTSYPKQYLVPIWILHITNRINLMQLILLREIVIRKTSHRASGR